MKRLHWMKGRQLRQLKLFSYGIVSRTLLNLTLGSRWGMKGCSDIRTVGGEMIIGNWEIDGTVDEPCAWKPHFANCIMYFERKRLIVVRWWCFDIHQKVTTSELPGTVPWMSVFWVVKNSENVDFCSFLLIEGFKENDGTKLFNEDRSIELRWRWWWSCALLLDF